MLLTGDSISAKDAVAMGLLNGFYETDEELDLAVDNVAEKIAAMPREVVAMGRRVFEEQRGEKSEERAYEIAGKAMVENLKLEEAREGIDAFLTKRKPVWK